MVQLSIASLGGEIFSVDAGLEQSIFDVKAMVSEKTGKPVLVQRLFMGMDELDNNVKIRSLPDDIQQMTLVCNDAEHEIWAQRVRDDWFALKDAPPFVSADRCIVHSVVSKSGAALEYASEELKGDRAIVLAAVRQNGLALRFASAAMCADLEVVLVATRQEGMALRYASEALRSNIDVVLVAASNFCGACVVPYVSQDFWQRSDNVQRLVAVCPGAAGCRN